MSNLVANPEDRFSRDVAHILCVQTAKDLARLHGCRGSSEPSLFVYVTCSLSTRVGSFALFHLQEVIRVTREFKCCAGCCWCANLDCCAHEITVEAPVGQVVGYVRQE